MECVNCSKAIKEQEARIENPDGSIYHVDCYPEPTPEPAE